MLVALVVFGLVMAGIAQTFRFGLAAWSAGPARTAEPESLAAMDAAVAQMIAQATPGSFTCLPRQFSFTTRLPAGAGLQGGLADAAIMPAGDSLILRYRLHPPGIPLSPLPAPSVEILAQKVASFSALYLTAKAGGGLSWVPHCKPGQPVLLVRLHLTLADGRDWPDLLAAPVNPGI